MDLSVIIPGRNEMFMAKTVENVLANIRGDSEVIAVLDGYWPAPPGLQDHPRLKVIHHTEAVGQRAATNDGAKLSRAKYVMKLDAHCAVDVGFDIKLMKDCQPNHCLVPAMHHLHAFDWVCKDCGHRTYQGVKPNACIKCYKSNLEMELVWKPRHNKPHISYRFDKNLQFQYWNSHAKRPECQVPLVETMSFIGACMFLERDRFWALGGMDEEHGSWGQFGTEWACKSWLSGGKLIGSRNTWFAHMFRTGNFAAPGHSTWPYPMSQEQIERAREHSRNLWLNNSWSHQVHNLEWLVEKFSPIPDWHEGA